MNDITIFLNQLSKTKWFKNCGVANERYHVIYSIYEAYDSWNKKMLDTWEPQICILENKARKMFDNTLIDEVFDKVSNEIQENLWVEYCSFVKRNHLENESGLEAEIMDCVKRDIAWLCIENMLNVNGFFNVLLDIYKQGYWPCSWDGNCPAGVPVVM